MSQDDATKSKIDAFTLYDCYLGPKPGRYAMQMQHELRREKVEWTGTAELAFEVTAPRLRLPSPGDVHAVYPTVGAAAFFGDTIPYVAFRRRSLPWERSIDRVTDASTDKDRATPWLALLILTPTDLGEAVLRSAPAGELLGVADKATVYSPWTDAALADAFVLSDDDRKLQVSLLELSAARLRAICPTRKELRLLAHVRQVDLRSKQDADPRASGDFALLMANRLPQVGLHTAVVVSLDGWGPWLDDDKYHATQDRVRVVALHSWQFTSVDGVGTCAAWVKTRLKVGAMAFGGAALGGDVDEAVRASLAEGYTPVAWQPDGPDSTRTFAWYRGPLGPIPTEPFANDSTAFERAGAALGVDPSTGMIDLSYAAAWQLGRLLALSSSSFGSAVRAWSRSLRLDALRREETAPAGSPEEAVTLVDDIVDYLTRHSSPSPGESFERVRVVTEWLANLVLLQPVPFRYLVPSDRLLERETLQVFHVDTRWLDALAEGALSVGVASLSDRRALRSNRARLRGVLRWMAARQRAIARGGELTRLDADDLKRPPSPLCGFLLRSQMLQAFPGVEVEVWSETGMLDVLRMDTVAEGVLLVIAQGEPTSVVVREPREGLRFGAIDKALWERDACGALVHEGAKYDVTSRDVTEAPGVVDVGALAARMKKTTDDLGSAMYALQWLLPPQDVEIPWRRTAG